MQSQAIGRIGGLGLLAALLNASPIDACTRVLWNQGGPVLVGRTMDWPESTMPVLTVLPRGLAHDGGKLGDHSLGDSNAKKWVSKYGSLITTVYGLGPPTASTSAAWPYTCCI
jgi:penicillin V acylase-like amidase (Ntn superfamily)